MYLVYYTAKSNYAVIWRNENLNGRNQNMTDKLIFINSTLIYYDDLISKQ